MFPQLFAAVNARSPILGWKANIVSCLLLFALLAPTAGAVGDKSETAIQQNLALPPIGSELKRPPVGVELYQVDYDPISSREALLLIPGLNSEHLKQCHWAKVIEFLKDHTEFSSKYKIYLARYKTDVPISTNVLPLRKTLLQLYQIAGNKAITIVALSLGGNAAQEAVLDPAVSRTVRTIMAFGTPFHGTPLFTPDWFQYSLYKNPSIHWSRAALSIAFNVYFDRQKALTHDLGWDNCDGLMPNPGEFRSKLPFGAKGNLLVADDTNARLLKLDSQHTLDKTKFITYAGYLHNPFMHKQLPAARAGTHIIEPIFHVLCVIPLFLAREHPVLKSTNWSMSRMICKQAPGSPRLDAYALNDGVSPVISALFLPNDFCKTHHLNNESSLSQLRGATDVGRARVFGNIDHVTFVDQKQPWFTSKQLQDELHPEEGKRPIFDWILYDLMNPVQDAKSASKTS